MLTLSCITTDFHVHKFVLHYHSAYFRAYFETLSNSSSSSSSDNSQPPCSHPHIAHCIHLPQQTEVVENEPVTAADFRLFLCHLYFASHYRYPPYLPKTDIDLELEADSAPLSLEFPPPPPSLEWCEGGTPMRSPNNRSPKSYDSLLTLAHYLDCAAMMKQCEAVLLTKVKGYERITSVQLAGKCAMWLQFAHRYNLRQWKAICLHVIAAAESNILLNKDYKSAKAKWDKELVLEILEAGIQRNVPQ